MRDHPEMFSTLGSTSTSSKESKVVAPKKVEPVKSKAITPKKIRPVEVKEPIYGLALILDCFVFDNKLPAGYDFIQVCADDCKRCKQLEDEYPFKDANGFQRKCQVCGNDLTLYSWECLVRRDDIENLHRHCMRTSAFGHQVGHVSGVQCRYSHPWIQDLRFGADRSCHEEKDFLIHQCHMSCEFDFYYASRHQNSLGAFIHHGSKIFERSILHVIFGFLYRRD